MKTRRPLPEDTGPLRIHIGRQSDGCSYALHPRSASRVKEAFPSARIAPRVFVGFDTQAAFEEAHGPIWDQIAQLLTGLTHAQLQALGGVELYDPDTGARRSVQALAS